MSKTLEQIKKRVHHAQKLEELVKELQTADENKLWTGFQTSTRGFLSSQFVLASRKSVNGWFDTYPSLNQQIVDSALVRALNEHRDAILLTMARIIREDAQKDMSTAREEIAAAQKLLLEQAEELSALKPQPQGLDIHKGLDEQKAEFFVPQEIKKW